jgi:hypothetical protein
MRQERRAWLGRLLVAGLVGVGVNAVLSGLSVDHDTALVGLLAATTVAVGVLTLEALDNATRVPWVARRPDTRPDRGEDTRTAMYRHVVEAHLTSREADDAVVWQLADLARRRLRQVHGLRPQDDPERTTALLGPVLAEWVSHDRRDRYVPGQRHPRYTVAALDEVVRRIEAL